MNPFPHHQIQQGFFRLPDEIFCKIFEFSLSDSPFDEYGVQEDGDIEMSWPTSKMTTPLTLSAVCSPWRNIACAEPSLWNSVYLVAVPGRAAQQACLLRDWLSRTGTLSLKIEIDCSDDKDRKWFPEHSDDEDRRQFADHSEKARNLLLVILPNSARIITFRTRLPPPCFRLSLPEDSIPKFTKLTTLSIVPQGLSNDEDDEGEVPMDVIELFKHAQNLRQLQIWEIDLGQLTIPWGNITEVAIVNMTLNDCISILRAVALKAEKCVFEGILWPVEDPDPTPILLPRLNLLHLDFGEVNVSQDLITRIITAPDLKTLEYITPPSDTFPVQDFVSCIERSGCALTDLSIINPFMMDTDLWSCLARVAPSLEYLKVEVTSGLPGVHMTKITPSRHVLTPSFPRLQSSIFKGPSAIIQSFIDMASLPQLL